MILKIDCWHEDKKKKEGLIIKNEIKAQNMLSLRALDKFFCVSNGLASPRDKSSRTSTISSNFRYAARSKKWIVTIDESTMSCSRMRRSNAVGSGFRKAPRAL